MSARLRPLRLAACLLLAAGTARAGVVRYRGALLTDGSRVAPHASASADGSDAAAARRRIEILRSPYLQISEERLLRGADLRIGFEQGVSGELRERVAAGAASFLAGLERDGWPRVGSGRPPLLLLVTSQVAAPAAAGWDGRETGLLVKPVVSVSAGGRDAAAVLLDAAHQIALLSLRELSPDSSAWLAEGTAEWLARRALGLEGEPAPADDPLLSEAGALTEPASLAEFLPVLVRRLPRGVADLRAAWEEMGSRRGDESEAVLRALALRADARGLAGLLGDLLTRRVAQAGADDPLAAARRALPSGGVPAAAPGPLGWRRVSLKTTDEGGGLEVVVPEGPRAATARALIGYRGDGDLFDATDLLPGVPRRIPLSGTARLGLFLVDGAEAGELFVEMRRLPEYPAALAGSSAEWTGEGVRLAWRTSWHRDLLAWVVTRVDETEGESREPQRRIVPTSESDDGGFAYELEDRETAAGHHYRYRVQALTTDGILAEAWAASLLAGR